MSIEVFHNFYLMLLNISSHVRLHLILKNEAVKQAMVYCMDNVEYSCHLSALVAMSLLCEASSHDALAARMSLVNDILHNSSIPSQFAYW